MNCGSVAVSDVVPIKTTGVQINCRTGCPDAERTPSHRTIAIELAVVESVFSSGIDVNGPTVIYPGEGGAAGIAVYGCLFLGKDAYATTEITGGGLETIVKQKGYGEDPLNQRSSVGWKATKTAAILKTEAVLRVECTSKYSTTPAN